MIDWLFLFTNALWVLGLSVLLAAFSYGSYRAATTSISFKTYINSPAFVYASSWGLILFCLGLAGTSDRRGWEEVLWLGLAAIFAGQAWWARRQLQGEPADLRFILQGVFHKQNVLAGGVILLALLLAALYAAIILPWMQPDEPRHFEVVQHVARLDKPLVSGADRVPEWEQEIIQSMEEHSFWWYGYSLVGWDPNNLPKSFAEIWDPAFSTAFFQAPLYYTLSGALMRLWDPALPLDQAVMRLRLAGLFFFTLSLWGIHRTLGELFPDHPRLVLTIFALAALWPSHLAANVNVNNDILAETIVIWNMYFVVRLLRVGPTPAITTWLTVLSLLGISTKRTALVAPVLFILALLTWAFAQKLKERRVLRWLVFLMGASLAILLAVLALESKWVGVPKTFIQELRDGSYFYALLSYPLAKHADAVLRTFYGWFGWMRVGLPKPLYWLGEAILILAGLGLIRAARLGVWRQLASWQKQTLILFLIALMSQIGFVMGKQILYADWIAGSLPQARYFYPLAPALFLFFGVGLLAWLPCRHRPRAFALVTSLLVVFNGFVLGFILYPFFWL